MKEFKKINEQCGAMIFASSGKSMKYMVDAFMLKHEGEYEKAIESLQIYHDSSDVADILVGEMMSQLYREIDQPEKAEEFITNLLKDDPNQPTYLLELSQVQFAEDKKDLAKETLNKCLDVWKNADPEYKSYQQAKDLMAKLE